MEFKSSQWTKGEKTGQNNSKQTIYMLYKFKLRNSNKAKSSPSNYGGPMQKG